MLTRVKDPPTVGGIIPWAEHGVLCKCEERGLSTSKHSLLIVLVQPWMQLLQVPAALTSQEWGDKLTLSPSSCFWQGISSLLGSKPKIPRQQWRNPESLLQGPSGVPLSTPEDVVS